VAAGGPVFLEMSGVTFMDSTGIKSILGALMQLPSSCVVLHGAHGTVARVLDLTGMSKLDNLHVISCSESVQLR
jgi:anti-anti-sigma factor